MVYLLLVMGLWGCQTAVATPPPPAATHAAYTHNTTLTLHPLAANGSPQVIDSCPDAACAMGHLRWSPDGRYLLYYRQQNGVGEYRLADIAGHVQTVTVNVNQPRPAAWSPDGRTILFLRQINPFLETAESDASDHLYGIWTVAIDEEGRLAPPQPGGELTVPATTCPPPTAGTGAAAAADRTVWASALVWAADDVLLYSLTCAGEGIGRYDLAASTPLPAYEETLHSLVVAPGGGRWYAVRPGTDGSHVVSGAPTRADFEVLPLASPSPRRLVVGTASGRLYLLAADALWVAAPDGSEAQPLWQGEGEVAFVAETAVDTLLIHTLSPVANAVWQRQPDGAAALWLADVGQLAVNAPQSPPQP